MASKYSHRNKSRIRLNAEINVTPFIDILLVLLVIFMVTMPAVMTGVTVHIPKASNLKPIPMIADKVEIIINESTEFVWVNNKKVKTSELIDYLTTVIKKEDIDKTIITIKGEKDAKYGNIMSIAAVLGSEGYKKLSLLMLLTNK